MRCAASVRYSSVVEMLFDAILSKGSLIKTRDVKLRALHVVLLGVKFDGMRVFHVGRKKSIGGQRVFAPTGTIEYLAYPAQAQHSFLSRTHSSFNKQGLHRPPFSRITFPHARLISQVISLMLTSSPAFSS